MIDISPSDLTIVIGDDHTVDVRASGTGARKALKRGRGLLAPTPVSPEMEAAAVTAFLAGADVRRLGRSLAAVYAAMEAVRRGPDAIDDDDDMS